MIVAADDVGDAHVEIVDHDRQHVRRRSVGAEQDEVVDLLVGDRDPPLDQVVDHRVALLRSLDADHIGLVFRPVRAVAPVTIDAERLALRLGRLARRRQLLLGHVAAIGGAHVQQLMGDLGMALLELRLEIGFAVAADAEPLQPIEDCVDRFLGRANLVRILDPQADICRRDAGRTAS